VGEWPLRRGWGRRLLLATPPADCLRGLPVDAAWSSSRCDIARFLRTPGCSICVSPMPRRIAIPSSQIGRSGKCSRPSGRSLFPMLVGRWIPRRAGGGLEDLPGAFRQQQILDSRQRRRASGRGPCLCGSHRNPPGRARRRRTLSLVRPRRGGLRSLITCRCWPASPAPCATAPPSRTGCCRPPWSGYGASSPASMTAIGRWSIS
jgi:hypothetical protein